MNVLIIGGTSGIGLGLARHYWEQGARVAVCGRRPEKLDGAAFARDSRVSVHACDIADRAAVARLVAEVARGSETAPGGLDLLIVTAGQYADAAALLWRVARRMAGRRPWAASAYASAPRA